MHFKQSRIKVFSMVLYHYGKGVPGTMFYLFESELKHLKIVQMQFKEKPKDSDILIVYAYKRVIQDDPRDQLSSFPLRQSVSNSK